MFLGLCNQLKVKINQKHNINLFNFIFFYFQVLDLTNNIVTLKPDYRETVLKNIPDLLFLDKISLTAISEQTKINLIKSEYLPENNGATSKSLNTTVQVSSFIGGWDHGQAFEVPQPSCAVPPVIHISIARRPMTSSDVKSKYDVSVGDPICGNIITKARQLRKMKTAWGDSLSSSSFSSSDSSTVGTPLNHPLKRTESCENLLESSRLWREKSKKSRENLNENVCVVKKK